MARRSTHDGPDGLAVVDKPAGWTSHDVVARARRLLGTRKVGHAGTLDPDATGVLVLGVGSVTRLLRFLSGVGKSYRGEMVLGRATDTLDSSGAVTGTWDMSAITLEDVRAAARRFVGDIEQVPPMVSALKVGGRRLHELAREGIEVERAPRAVHIARLEVEPTAESGVFALELDCSSGTYVRSLAADLGASLGGGAHLRNLRRLSVGCFGLDEAVELDSLEPARLLSPAEALRWLPTVAVSDDEAASLRLGRRLAGRAGVPAVPAPWRAVDPAGALVAVLEARGSDLQPVVVLPPARTGEVPPGAPAR
ncbi:MAG: tRNA pseudouridine(55) synthase TruB [Acidimicrobiia bacterium]|nr:tRNA pseudouridine(55) synthase TruB [Acidimicrobiia bacterium]